MRTAHRWGGEQDPRRFLRVTLAPAVKAFRSASRAVSVPDTIEALEEAADLEPRIVRFVIPVGANVSMSGTALVVSAAAVTLATLDGLELGPEEMLIIRCGFIQIPMAFGRSYIRGRQAGSVCNTYTVI
ncbi:hypothetical protein HPB48_004116 [Haemaphysalis longicornis]|uniref:Amino acid transporter n=1 Tax=Haemaphysalis longicornis TaxID=44386 RepID=A0A9J6FSG3_HAELO|nr:hypothetical protein HPB48_004116 [Haemaphysalis longicornis]